MATSRALLNFYQAGRNKGDFEDGIERALQAILSDPEFVFRGEADPANVNPGKRIASAIWNSPRACLSSCGAPARMTN